MSKSTFISVVFLMALVLNSLPAAAKIQCRMSYTLKTWSVLYKQGKGWGDVVCDNGEKFKVTLKTHGGGVSFGKSKITGTGNFSGVDIADDLFGSYAAAEAHAGIKKSARALALTKGDISLSLTGTGDGFDLGFAFGGLTIKRK